MNVPERARLRVIVADNDAEPSARALVEGLRPEMPFDILYVHCPHSNISIARNCCLDNSTGDFLAFLDDDETVSGDWLTRLLETARTTEPPPCSARSGRTTGLRPPAGCAAAISTDTAGLGKR